MFQDETAFHFETTESAFHVPFWNMILLIIFHIHLTVYVSQGSRHTFLFGQFPIGYWQILLKQKETGTCYERYGVDNNFINDTHIQQCIDKIGILMGRFNQINGVVVLFLMFGYQCGH